MLTTTIFIGGSRAIVEIPTAIQARLQRIVERGHEVVVGDAPGVDVLTQRCFVESGYQRVTVCHSGQRCRNILVAGQLVQSRLVVGQELQHSTP